MSPLSKPRRKKTVRENLKPFKKGQSGNPNGRPKGSRNRSTIVREILSVIMLGENPITGKKEKLTIEEQMIFSMISQVIHKGNVHAWNSIKDDAYGKNKESVEMSGDILNILTPPTMSFEEWEKKTQTITKQI
jgi:hypothetical protein